MNYQCSKCNYLTNKKTDYSRHLNSQKHKNNTKKIYICSECDKRYEIKSSYYYHINKCQNKNYEQFVVKLIQIYYNNNYDVFQPINEELITDKDTDSRTE